MGTSSGAFGGILPTLQCLLRCRHLLGGERLPAEDTLPGVVDTEIGAEAKTSVNEVLEDKSLSSLLGGLPLAVSQHEAILRENGQSERVMVIPESCDLVLHYRQPRSD